MCCSSDGSCDWRTASVLCSGRGLLLSSAQVLLCDSPCVLVHASQVSTHNVVWQLPLVLLWCIC